MGRTLATLADECNVSSTLSLKPSIIKRCMEYMPIYDDQKWRIGVGIELLTNYHNGLDIPGFTREETKTMLDFVCTT